MSSDIKCLSCEHCCFNGGKVRPLRWYCDHPQNPNRVDGVASMTKIASGGRHTSENDIPRKKEPKWCPLLMGQQLRKRHNE